jgi:uncharacterized protein YjdB
MSIEYNESKELEYDINKDYSKNAVIVFKILSGSDLVSFSDTELLTERQVKVSAGFISIYAAESSGNASIIAYLKDDTKVESTLTITVKEPLLNGIAISSDSDTVGIGDKLQLEAFLLPSEVFDEVEWSIDVDSSIATISPEGELTAYKGAANKTEYNRYKGARVLVTATSPEDPYRLSATKQIIIVNDAPVAVVISEALHSINPSETISLSATVEPLNAYQDVVWVSTNPAVVTVNSNGTVVGVAGGTATITAASYADGNVFASYAIEVKEFIPVSIGYNSTVPATVKINGTTATFQPSAVIFTNAEGIVGNISFFHKDSTGKPILSGGGDVIVYEFALSDSSYGTITFSSSSNTDTPKFVANELTGTVELIISVRNHPEIVSVPVEITITADEYATNISQFISSNTDLLTIAASSTTKNKVSLEAALLLDTPIKLTAKLLPSSLLPANRTVIWTSSDPTIVAIDANTGVLTFLTVGLVTITAEAVNYDPSKPTPPRLTCQIDVQ